MRLVTMTYMYGLLMAVAVTSAMIPSVPKKATIALGNTYQKVPKAQLRRARTGQVKQWDYTLYVKQLDGEAGAVRHVEFYPDINDNTYKPASYPGEKTADGTTFYTRHDCWGRSLALAQVTMKDGSIYDLKKSIRMREDNNDLVFELEYTAPKKKKKKKKKEPAKKTVKKAYSVMSGRSFGVEVEFDRGAVSTQELCYAVESATETKCLDRGYDTTTTKAWKLVPDNSINNGYEIVSPILYGNKGLRELGDAMDAIESYDDVSVPSTCGLHVHVGLNDIKFDGLKRICQYWVKYEEGIDLMLDEQRSNEAGNQYCLSVRENMKFKQLYNNEAIRRIDEAQDERALAKLMNAHPQSGQRYFKLNLQNLVSGKRNTLEFRAHEGTLDAETAENWVRFLIAFIETSVKSPTPKPFSDNADKDNVFSHLFTHFIPEHSPSLKDFYHAFCYGEG